MKSFFKTASAALLVCALVLTACPSLISAARSYSYDEAWRYHYYIRASYCEESTVEAWNCGPSCASLPNFQVHTILNCDTLGTRGYVGLDHANAQIVVAFRGSDNLQNWLADFTLVQVPYDMKSSCGQGCKVHTGFFASYLSVRKAARTAVLDLLSAYPTYEILVTGHSLGGAMATLAAVDLQERVTAFNNTPASKPVSLYTFASPLVGNPAFARWAANLLSEGTNYRITHGRDPVVRIPFRSWDYAHLPNEVFYKTRLNNSMTICKDSVGKQDTKCSGGMLSVIAPDHIFYMGVSTMCDCDTCDLNKVVASIPASLYSRLTWEYFKGWLSRN